MKVTHGGDVWQGDRPEAWLDFSASLNPDGAPEWARAAMAAGLKNAGYYPDAREAAAWRGLSAHLRVAPECLLPTNGGIEAAAIAARALGRCAIAQPTFQEYARLCGEHRDVPLASLADFVPRAGEWLWLCNPNNPTGAALDRDAVLALLARLAAAGGGLVADEAFIDYCPENSVVDAVMAHKSLIVLGSLTKSLAIPGIRLGYLAAHPSVIEALSERLAPWRLNCAAEAVAAALGEHEADFIHLRELNARRRQIFAEALRAIGAAVYPSDANFLLTDFGRDMRPTVAALRERRILVRPCGMFAGLTHGHLRLCVRTEAENARLVQTLKELL